MTDSKTLSEQISASRYLLQNPHAYENGEGEYDALPLQALSEQPPQKNRTSKPRYGDAQIEQAVRGLHREIWRRRREFWPDGVPADPTKLLDPAIAAACLGYRFDKPEYIGAFDARNGGGEIAGIIDRDERQIRVANNLPYITHRFTAAHELGHAVLHSGTGLHRDRAADGSSIGPGRRDAQESDADKFAAYFLMPEKLVRERFDQIFGATDAFRLTDDTAFALNPSDPEGLIRRCRHARALARVLASTEYYNGRHVCSLASQFDVSVEAMAIRLEDLALVDVES